MLVLSRKVGQKIRIGQDIEITINKISGSRVSLGVSAPDFIRVVRQEAAEAPPMPRLDGAGDDAPSGELAAFS